MMDIPALRLSGIRRHFGATVALDGVDLDAAAGEVHALIGENGAGKSTLMRILSGALTPDFGWMELAGHAYGPRSPADARKAGVAMVNQELAIAPHLSVTANITLGAEPLRRGFLDRAAAGARAAAALRELGRPDLPLEAPAGSLSLADQQMVEIARAVALGCRILILDEPTSSLSQADTAKLFALIGRLRGQGRSVIYISHFLEEVLALCDRYTVLRDGRSVATGAIQGATVEELAQLMVGRRLDALYQRSRHAPGSPVLSVNSLGGTRRPADASFELRRGEVLGIAGLVGAGRSELLRAIFSLDPVRRGQVRIAGYSGARTPRRLWRHGVGFLSEDRKNEGLALDLSLADNLTLPRLPSWVSPETLAAESRPWLGRLSLKYDDPRQPAGTLSGGNQQKLALARLLRNGADVLLLDEPTRGIDLGAKQTIYRLIDQLAIAGKAVLLTSSHLPELLGLCDRVAVMNRGVLGSFRPAADWTEHQMMMAATLGTCAA